MSAECPNFCKHHFGRGNTCQFDYCLVEASAVPASVPPFLTPICIFDGVLAAQLPRSALHVPLGVPMGAFTGSLFQFQRLLLRRCGRVRLDKPFPCHILSDEGNGGGYDRADSLALSPDRGERITPFEIVCRTR